MAINVEMDKLPEDMPENVRKLLRTVCFYFYNKICRTYNVDYHSHVFVEFSDRLPKNCNGCVNQEDNLIIVSISNSFKYDLKSLASKICTIAHEFVHVEQIMRKDMIIEDNEIFWQNEKMDLGNIPYMNRKWENEAFQRQEEMTEEFINWYSNN